MWILLSFLTGTADACVVASPRTMSLDLTIDDDLVPAPPDILGVDVTRGRGPRRSFLTSSVTSCDDLGSIQIAVARPAGDPDDETTVGYRLETIDGSLPDGLALWDDAGPLLGPDLSLTWNDGAEDDQDPFDVTLAVFPVDGAGNEGEPTEVRLTDDGVPLPNGCSTVPGSAGGLAGLVWVAVCLRRRSPAR